MNFVSHENLPCGDLTTTHKAVIGCGTMDLYSANPGPIDDSVLYDQDKHVSSAVWEGQERGALRCHEHTSKLDQWMLTEKQIGLVERAGFGYLRLIPAISLDNPLISALVERWRRETNTFHLNVGEMTVTLEDVAYLLGLAIDGEPVIGVTYTTCDFVCEKFLGKAPDSGYTSGGMVKLSWLKEFFSQCPNDASIEDVERHTRAYLLYLVGSTIFSTTTGNKVPVMYLPLFENFDQAGTYAWGAAALAFLYRALGNASLRSQSTISGCLTLLQCWSYYHLNIGRPKLNHDPLHDSFPLVLKWKGKQSGPTTNRDVTYYRKALDTLQPNDVEWLPYIMMTNMGVPEGIKNSLILGRSKTMLICFDKAERHVPDRCLRQCGLPQPIPKDVQRWERKSRGVDGGVDLSLKMESELNEWSERRLNIVEDDEGVYESEYMQWYLNITRKFVGRPVPLSSEFQRMNAALRDIAHIADTVSTQGMDDQQIQSVTRIRYIVHECLRDQVGGSMLLSNSPQNDLRKRIRGKEKVRRKGMGKRKRKDDPEQLLASADDDQLQLTVVAGEIDESQICHVDGEVEHVQLCHAACEGEQPSHAPNVVDDSQLYDATDLCHAVDENDTKPLETPVEAVLQSSLGSGEDIAQQNDQSVLV
ncbi:protein MAIN-LIKE 2-like [Malania oleifera]|uniref:protein MAIN-LIKE 2-like n=1 Tax=Malania oleifera TaxID=397392 RepID=UPI0025AE79FF|nr:protein MAIN-LIKE 2-like [Malania oleifera]